MEDQIQEATSYRQALSTSLQQFVNIIPLISHSLLLLCSRFTAQKLARLCVLRSACLSIHTTNQHAAVNVDPPNNSQRLSFTSTAMLHLLVCP